jgi:hypothetical protein
MAWNEGQVDEERREFPSRLAIEFGFEEIAPANFAVRVRLDCP